MPAEREITVRDLLSHTSGLISGTISSHRAEVGGERAEKLADFIPRLARTPLEFQPGTRWAYSAQAASTRSPASSRSPRDMPFDQFAKQRIFDPLGMKDTFFYPAEGNPRMATLYRSRRAWKSRTSIS